MAWWNLFRRPPGRKPQWLVAGLGNPGPEYRKSRHNFGFVAAATLLERYGGRWSAPGEAPAEIGDCRIGSGARLRVVRPLSFMNRSGEPVSRELRRAGLGIDRLIVLVDDLALPLGTLRIRQGGGDGGHNGLRSMAGELDSGDYLRVRLGVSPVGGMPTADEWVEFVLGSFEPEEEDAVRKVAGLAADAVVEIVDRGPLPAMSRFNQRQQK